MAHPWSLIAPPVTGLVVPVRVDPAGRTGPTRGQARGPSWRRTSPGRFVPAEVSDELVEQRILEAYAGAGPRAVITGWAGLRLLGWRLLRRAGPRRRDPAARCRSPRTASGSTHDPASCVTARPSRPTRSCWSTACGARSPSAPLRRDPTRGDDLEDQVVAADMAFGGELTSIRRMRRYRWTRYWYRDVRRLDRVLPLRQRARQIPPRGRLPARLGLRRGWGRPAGQPRGARPRRPVRRHPGPARRRARRGRRVRRRRPSRRGPARGATSAEPTASAASAWRSWRSCAATSPTCPGSQVRMAQAAERAALTAPSAGSWVRPPTAWTAASTERGPSSVARVG